MALEGWARPLQVPCLELQVAPMQINGPVVSSTVPAGNCKSGCCLFEKWGGAPMLLTRIEKFLGYH